MKWHGRVDAVKNGRLELSLTSETGEEAEAVVECAKVVGGMDAVVGQRVTIVPPEITLEPVLPPDPAQLVRLQERLARLREKLERDFPAAYLCPQNGEVCPKPAGGCGECKWYCP